MTREETAIKSCEDRIKHLESAPPHHYGKRQRERAIEPEKVKIRALRPVSREQMKKVHAIWNFVGTANDNDIYRCSNCGNISADCTRFCPNCGAPMTDEAVEMVMERMEALR